MSTFWQRLTLILVGVVLIGLAFVFRSDTVIHDTLILAGGPLIGAAGVRRPGDIPTAASSVALFVLATFAFVSMPACHSLNALWPRVAQCAPGVSDLVSVVTQILLTSANPQGDLEDLARQEGAEEVICVVDKLVSDWSSPQATASSERTVAITKGRAFLAKTGTRVEHVQ